MAFYSRCLIQTLRWQSTLLLGVVLAASVGVQATAEENAVRGVELEWDEVAGAKSYEIEVTAIGSLQKAKPHYFKTKKTAFNGHMKPGHYNMRIRSYDKRGVPGDWSALSDFWVDLAEVSRLAPEKQSVVKATTEKLAKVTFAWKPVVGARKYRLIVEGEGFKKEQEVDSSHQTLELPVAQTYRWQVNAITVDGHQGDLPEVWTFALWGPRLDTPEIDEPPSKYVQDLRWKKPDEATLFQVRLSRREKGKWNVVEKNDRFQLAEMPFPTAYKGGRYRLEVRATAPLRESSEVARKEFDVAFGDRSPTAVEQAVLRESIERPSRFYAIASYFLTQIEYEGQYFETDTTTRYSALGGTGRVGVGYNLPSSNWGAFATLDMSGFNVGDQTSTYSTMAANATYTSYWGVNQVRWLGGLSYRELPATIGNNSAGTFTLGKVAWLGPQVGIQWWHPVNSRYGILAEAQLSSSTSSVQTPNGKSVLPSVSYQASVLGSYRMSRRWMGYAGYSFHSERIRYQTEAGDSSKANSTLAPAGAVDSVRITGHYLNLILEYGF